MTLNARLGEWLGAGSLSIRAFGRSDVLQRAHRCSPCALVALAIYFLLSAGEAGQQLCARGDVIVDAAGNVRYWESEAAAAEALANEFFAMCGKGQEMSISIYVKDSRYYAANPREGDETGVEPDLRRTDVNLGGRLVAGIHNHPRSLLSDASGFNWNRQNLYDLGSWPSVSDFKSANANRIRVYAVDCSSLENSKARTTILALDPRGNVYRVMNGKYGRVKRPFGAGDCDLKNGHSFWDPKKYADHVMSSFSVASTSAATRGLKKPVSEASGRPSTVRNRDFGRPAPSTGGSASPAMKSGGANVGVGILGWCHCREKHPRAQLESLVLGSLFSEHPAKYAFKVCRHCGRCRRPRNRDDFTFFDNELEAQIASGKLKLPTSRYDDLRRQVQNRFLSIPDGSVVIPGQCACKEPDPLYFFDHPNEVYICVKCGRLYVSADGQVPIGPTRAREMGLKPKRGQQL